MKDGYKVIDMDTHVGPGGMVALEQYVDPSFRPRLAELEQYKATRYISAVGKDVTSYDVSLPVPLNRFPGTPLLPEHETPGAGQVAFNVPQGAGGKLAHHRVAPRSGSEDKDPEARILDMDDEGRDVDFMFAGPWVAAVQSLGDPTISEGFYRAQHRFLTEYTSGHTDRLKSHALVPGDDVEWAVEELNSLSKEKWLGGVWVQLPEKMPIDDPSLEPLWATMNDLEIPLVHHSFFVGYPYFPGYRDLWGNSVICRTAAHPWGAARLFSYLVVSGIFDRHPNFKCAIAECGHGWLPQWAIRLGEMMYYVSGMTPQVNYRPLEYVQQGRFMTSCEPMEGPDMTKACIDILGDGALMHQSDYPHGEAYFPDTASMIINWPIWEGLGEEALRKHMAGNAESFLGSRL